MSAMTEVLSKIEDNVCEFTKEEFILMWKYASEYNFYPLFNRKDYESRRIVARFFGVSESAILKHVNQYPELFKLAGCKKIRECDYYDMIGELDYIENRFPPCMHLKNGTIISSPHRQKYFFSRESLILLTFMLKSLRADRMRCEIAVVLENHIGRRASETHTSELENRVKELEHETHTLSSALETLQSAMITLLSFNQEQQSNAIKVLTSLTNASGISKDLCQQITTT